MRKKIIGAVVIVAALLGVVGFVKYNEYSAKEAVVKVELGDKISEKPEDYVKANKKALKKTVLDLSKVDQKKVGKYQAKASCDKKSVTFEVEIVDTTKPKLMLVKTESGSYQAVVGQPLNGTALMESVEDLAGIKTISFSDGQMDGNKESENPVEQVALKWDEVGEKEVTISVEDNSGNVTKETVKVKVVEDYLAHVTGMQDLTVEQGSSIDWMAGITKDEKVVEVTADASKVDLNTAGEYTLTYVVKGDDKETTVTKEVKVTVVTPQKAQELADSGSFVKTTGGTKKKTTRSSGSRSSSGGSSKSSGGKKNSGGASSGGSGFKPGQTWEGTTTGSGYIGSGNADTGANTYEEGTWNPFE